MKFFNKKEVRKKEYFLAGILAIIVILCFWHYLKIKQKHRQKFIDQVSNFEISAEVLERIQIMSQIQGQDYIELLARYADKNNYRLQDIDILKNKKK
ncbi:MAG: hypothetical protein GX238_10075 [Epulopiscium sp.]|nr:hypothetical protein [Candidatus Epulonipiscium sp.]